MTHFRWWLVTLADKCWQSSSQSHFALHAILQGRSQHHQPIVLSCKYWKLYFLLSYWCIFFTCHEEATVSLLFGRIVHPLFGIDRFKFFSWRLTSPQLNLLLARSHQPEIIIVSALSKDSTTWPVWMWIQSIGKTPSSHAATTANTYSLWPVSVLSCG